jgi:citronellol/citronellal dehydrogenase
MSLCVLGFAGEFAGKVAVNALWPRTAIATAAVANVLADDSALAMCRKPEILADAAYEILSRPVSFTGNFLIDDSFLYSCGFTDFDPYRVDPTVPLLPDFFVPDDIPAPPGVEILGPLLGGAT